MKLSEIMQYKDGIPHYDFTKTINYLEYQGKLKFGKKFYISSYDYEIIYQIICWILNDHEGCKRYNISYHKGLLISGPVGCGKTALMQLFASITPLSRTFVLKPARDVTMEFNKEGYDVIYKYSQSIRIPKPICFDDIGIEPSMKHYGDQINVIGEILLSRYELFISKGIQTHATTNLNAKELEDRYGIRVRSRMREMFNLIAFPADAKDKRT